MPKEIIISMIVTFFAWILVLRLIDCLGKRTNKIIKGVTFFGANFIYTMFTYLGLLVYIGVSACEINDLWKTICLFLCILIPNYLFRKIIPDADVDLKVCDKRTTFLLASIGVMVSGFVVKELAVARVYIVKIIVVVVLGFFVPFEVWIGEYGVRGKVAPEKEVLNVIKEPFEGVNFKNIICDVTTLVCMLGGGYISEKAKIMFEKIELGFVLGTVAYVVVFVVIYKLKHRKFVSRQ